MDDNEVIDLDLLLEQEARLTMAGFDFDCAFRLGYAMVERAKEAALPIAIAIRRNGRILFSAALPGSSRDNEAWLARKARVVDRFGHSSLYVRELLRREQGVVAAADRDLPSSSYALFGGSFPVVVARTGPVGTVTVSGLPDVDDHRFVIDCLEAHLNDHRDGGLG